MRLAGMWGLGAISVAGNRITALEAVLAAFG
jgi:hypothetical protein